MEKICIKGMNHEELQTLCIKAGESKFRGGQLFEWLDRHGISSFDSMLNINKSFREHLNKHFILHTLTVENSLPSEDASGAILRKNKINFDCFFIANFCLLKFSQLSKYFSKIIIRICMIRVNFDCFFIANYCI